MNGTRLALFDICRNELVQRSGHAMSLVETMVVGLPWSEWGLLDSPSNSFDGWGLRGVHCKPVHDGQDTSPGAVPQDCRRGVPGVCLCLHCCSRGLSEQHHHTGGWAALKSIYREGGIRGLYRGVSGSVGRMAVASTVQLSTYSQVCMWSVCLAHLRPL
jgi:hypothetical protein